MKNLCFLNGSVTSCKFIEKTDVNKVIQWKSDVLLFKNYNRDVQHRELKVACLLRNCTELCPTSIFSFGCLSSSFSGVLMSCCVNCERQMVGFWISQCISGVVLLGHLLRDSVVRAGNGSRSVLRRFSWSLFNLLFDSLLNLDTHKAGGQVLSPWELKVQPCRALLICQKKTIGPGQVLVEFSSVIAQRVSIPSLQSRWEPVRAVLWIPQPWVEPNSAPHDVPGTQLRRHAQLLCLSFFLHVTILFCMQEWRGI